MTDPAIQKKTAWKIERKQKGPFMKLHTRESGTPYPTWIGATVQFAVS